jgi:cyclic-di-GMP phosphodiesterase TipF (flagellum assembly factor)
MSLLRHIVFALSYGVLAIAAALTLPYSIPGMERWTAIVIGGIVLIFGAVLHEVWARQERERALRGELIELTAARDAVLGELSRAREEVRSIQWMLEESRRPPAVEEVKAEMQALQRMIAQISGREAGGEDGETGEEPKAAARAGQGGKGGAEREIDPAGLASHDLLALVRDAIRHDRIDMVMQPIVSLPQRKLRHQQAYSRIRNRDGTYLLPHRAAGLIARAGLATTLDNLLLFRCVQLMREMLRRHRSTSVFAGIAMNSLKDGDFMDQFVEFMTLNPELAPRLILELPIDEIRDASESVRQPLDRLAGLGIRFCVHGFRYASDLDLGLIGESGQIRFLKLDARTLLSMVEGPLPLDMRALKQDLDRLAIDLIVDGIDGEPLLVEILDLPIDYGQGRLFGAPR